MNALGMSALENQTLALAGIFQSAALIEQLAYQGELSQAAFDCSFDTLFTFEAESTLDVFGDVSGLSRGLQSLSLHLDGSSQTSAKNLVYYIMSMLKLSSRLIRDNQLAENLQSDLQKIEQQSVEFELGRASVVSKVDGLYQDTISNLQPRIIVRGEHNHLTNPGNAAKVRALLLAGIRAAVLWHQLGGSKWKLVFSRKKYVEKAKQLLAGISP